MSALGAYARTKERPEPFAPDEHGSRRRLAAVRGDGVRRAKPRLFYAGITVATVVGIVVAQLMLSIGVTQGAYQISSLRDSKTALQRSYQSVSEDVNALSSPQNLAANADALGMVNNGTPVYLRLSDGAVLGSPAAASAAEGTVTGASGNLVANQLLTGVPLAGRPPGTDPSATATRGDTAPADATPKTNTEKAPDAPVALDGALPSPTTH